MRNLKKVLALVIAFSMMLSVVAFASYNDVAADAEYAGAVELLSALEIIKGDDLGNFNPDNTITRAEMAAIVCRAKGLESAANGAKGFTAFNDVAADHWASGYVNLASQNGIINGYGDGNFGPEDTVTYEQAVKMLVCAIGYEPMAATKGGFPTGYLVVANAYGITEGVTASVEAPRKTVAQLVYNTLETPMMDQTAFGAEAEYQIFDGKGEREYKTLLTEMDIYIATGVVGTKDADVVEFEVTEDSEGGEDYAEFKKGDEPDFEINGTDIAAYQHQNVDVYVKKDARNDYKVIAIVASAIGETFEIISSDIVVPDKGFETTDDYVIVEYYVDAANSSKTKELKVDKDAAIEYNKTEYGKASADLKTLVSGSDDVILVFVENDDYNGYDTIVATEYFSGLVDSVLVEKDKLEVEGKTIEFDFENEDITTILVDDAGNELTLADFAEDDVVAVIGNPTTKKLDDFDDYETYIKVVKLTNSAVTGTIEETYVNNEGDFYITVNGEEYLTEIKSLGVGDEGIFYVSMTGKVVEFDGSVVGENYGFILALAETKDTFGSKTIWQIKMLTEADGIVTYDVDVDDVDMDKFITDSKIKVTTGKDGYDYADFSKSEAGRLVAYDTNSNGEIDELAAPAGNVRTVTDKEYNGDTMVLKHDEGSASLEEDVVVFNVDVTDEDNAYATDVSFLVDEGTYTGWVLRDADMEYSVAVITSGTSPYSEELGFAIATKVSKATDEAGEDILRVTYVQNEEEGTIVINDDSENEADNAKEAKDTTALAAGDVFLFTANAEGVAMKYVKIATVVDEKVSETASVKVLKLVNTDVNIGKDTKLYLGYIGNDGKIKTPKGEMIEVANDGKVDYEASITSDTNR